MEFESLHVCRPDARVLTEHFKNGAWSMRLAAPGSTLELAEYTLAQLCEEDRRTPWGGAVPEDLLASGADLLGRRLLEQGEPTYEQVRQLLPPLAKGAYCFLSGRASWAGVMVDPQGRIFPQGSGSLRQQDPLFAPVLLGGALGESAPVQFLLDGRYPLLFSVHSDPEQVLEFLYFVEPGDPDRNPVVWIRVRRYPKAAPQNYTVEYRLASLSRASGRPISPETFFTALADTVADWADFAGQGAAFSLPEPKLEKVASGAMMACAATFTADHAHYGHFYYGLEIHDNFPPNYIWALEACCLLGRTPWARRLWQHLLLYVLNDCGRFVYRQGDRELFGASAVEYGQLLFLGGRYAGPLGAAAWPDEYWQKLCGMGRVLLSHCEKCTEFGGRLLLRMCAEADTNTRVHVYLNNNLWGVRGLQALAGLLNQYGRSSAAEPFQRTAAILLENIRALTAEHTVQTRYGPLVPFRFGYTATPHTLSTCREPFAPLTPAQLRSYLVRSTERSQGSAQDLTENTYANYRYYPEALSAMLLDPQQAQAIMAAREGLGGEYLGMTRFFGWVDDWPVAHYARYLLEAGRAEKYLLLLYAHTAHHGNPELMCYYEQVSTEGAVVAPDCVPSLLTTPILTAWMFAYETVDACRLILLGAVPKSWFKTSFSAHGLGFSGGSCGISYAGGVLELYFSAPLPRGAEVVWRGRASVATSDLCSGAEYVERTLENRLFLKRGVTHVRLSFA